MTDSETEQRFLPIVRRAGLPLPLTQQWVNDFRVDFYWPELRLVVETDGLRYHRTPAEQAADRLRDQVHTASGLTCLRFTRAQIRFEPSHVQEVLTGLVGDSTLDEVDLDDDLLLVPVEPETRIGSLHPVGLSEPLPVQKGPEPGLGGVEVGERCHAASLLQKALRV
jgi:very-short-patch-repair endonuclease